MTEPTKTTPYNPTIEMREAMKRTDPALTHEQCRAIWAAAWSAAPVVAMAPRMMELLADITPIENHDDNGPGSVSCPACDAYMHMRWKGGYRIDNINDLAHDDECPAEWARAALAAAQKGGE